MALTREESTPRAASSAEQAYEALRSMAVTFRFRPGERLNEGELARTLNVSRTPLREALNRLSMEGFLTMEPNRGFFCRPFDAKEIFDLYEMRRMLESQMARLACARCEPEEVEALADFLRQTQDAEGKMPVTDLLAFDEEFHERIARMSRNQEVLRVLRNVNARIHFFRWIDMEGRRRHTQSEHWEIIEGLRRRDADACERYMATHIERRLDQIVDVVKEGVVRIYMGNGMTGSADGGIIKEGS